MRKLIHRFKTRKERKDLEYVLERLLYIYKAQQSLQVENLLKHYSIQYFNLTGEMYICEDYKKNDRERKDYSS